MDCSSFYRHKSSSIIKVPDNELVLRSMVDNKLKDLQRPRQEIFVNKFKYFLVLKILNFTSLFKLFLFLKFSYINFKLNGQP